MEKMEKIKVKFRKNPNWDVIYIEGISSKPQIIENIISNINQEDYNCPLEKLVIDIIDINLVSDQAGGFTTMTTIVTYAILFD